MTPGCWREQPCRKQPRKPEEFFTHLARQKNAPDKETEGFPSVSLSASYATVITLSGPVSRLLISYMLDTVPTASFSLSL